MKIYIFSFILFSIGTYLKPMTQPKQQTQQQGQNIITQGCGFDLSTYLKDNLIENMLPEKLTALDYKDLRDTLLTKGTVEFIKAKTDNPKHPLYQLRECIDKDCPFNRLKHPEMLTSLENANCAYIAKQFANETEISYTNLASNRLLPTLITLTKLAYLLKGTVKITFYVNLIDKLYQNVLNFYSMKESQGFLANPQARQLTDEAFQTNQEDNEVLYHFIFCQFMQWLKMLEQDANCTINVRLFTNPTEYLNACKEHKELKCHLLDVVDINSNRCTPVPAFLSSVFHPLVYETIRDKGAACLAVSYFGVYVSISSEPKYQARIEQLFGINESKTPRRVNNHKTTVDRSGKVIESTTENYLLPEQRNYSEYSDMAWLEAIAADNTL